MGDRILKRNPVLNQRQSLVLEVFFAFSCLTYIGPLSKLSKTTEKTSKHINTRGCKVEFLIKIREFEIRNLLWINSS